MREGGWRERRAMKGQEGGREGVREKNEGKE